MSYLDLEILLRVPYVEPYLGFDISPDGSQVAFSWNKTGRWEIYVQERTANLPPHLISTGAGAKFAPRWNPDGTQLAYVLDLDGAENYDIIIHDLSTGTPTNITAHTPDALASSFAWSPDGSQIAFCSDRAGRFDTYIMPSQGGEARIVLDQPRPDWTVSWSPDGGMLAVTSEGEGHDHWTFLVPLEGDQPTLIGVDGNPICAKDACWSPDGRYLAFASNLHGQYQIGVYEIASGSLAWLTEGDGEKEYPDWSEDGCLTYVISHGPKTELAIMEIASRKVSTFRFEPGVIFTPKFTPDDQQIMFVFDNPRHPDDLWSFSREKSEFQQVTRSFPAKVNPNTLCMPEEVRYPGLDGVDIPALLYRPQSRGALPPAVITIHGGPNWLTQITWDPLVQHMVSRGWVVLAPNYRGSTGYGRAWMNANRFDLGGVDTADVVAGVNFLVRQGMADPSRIALTGRSWGGYLTMTCLTQFPDKWAAGSAVVPFLNWFTSHQNSRPDLQHWDIENFGDPVRNYERWYQRSPFFFLDQIQAPVQLICGAHDVRCPASESCHAYQKLIELGKACEYHLYSDEGHSFLKTENQIKEKTQRAAFLARYLEVSKNQNERLTMLKKAKQLQSQMIDWRRDFHMHPELGFQEHRTSRKVAEVLTAFGYRVRTGVGKTGIVAEMGHGKPVVAIRADMDALPILDAKDVPYKSQNEGVMHACGHDAHTAIALGTAKLLSQQEFSGTIRFLFQPAEEVQDDEGLSGAPRMIEDGAIDGVDYVLALHVDAGIPTGKIMMDEFAAAGVDTVQATIFGKGGHGAMPHTTVDPIIISAQVILSLNGIVSRRLWPFDPAVVTIGSIHGGQAENVIPSEVTLGMTIRYLTEDVKEKIHQEIERSLEIASTLGGDYQMDIQSGYPPAENHPEIISVVKQVVSDLISPDALADPQPEMGSEDFGFFACDIPGGMFMLGCQIEGDERRHHAPRFDIDEDCMPIGVAVLTESALRLLNQSKL